MTGHLATNRVLRVGCALLGLMWLWAAVTKAIDPAGAYEFTTMLVGSGTSAKPVLTVWAALEAGLGAAMLLGATRGLVATGAGLAAATGALLLVRARFGGAVKCGCMAFVPDTSVDAGVSRNLVLLGVVAVLGALAISARRARGAAAASGPATPAP